MFQLTITYLSGDIHVTKVFPGRRPSTHKAKGTWTYQSMLAWCARRGTAVSYGDNCQTWEFNS